MSDEQAPIQWLTPRFADDPTDNDGHFIPASDIVRPSSDFAEIAGKLMAAAVDDHRASTLSYLVATSMLPKRPPPPPLAWRRRVLNEITRRIRRARYLAARTVAGYDFHADDECECY